MMILCPNGAGGHDVVLVSPDFSMDRRDECVANAVVVRYVYDGEAEYEFLLSPEFARAHDLVGGDQPLPAQYPPWMKELHMICSHCFDAGLKSPE
jgi:hypothetical protein